MNRMWALVAGAGVMAGLACGSDNTGPSIAYPNLSETVRTALCWRGNMTTRQSTNGSLASTDCDYGPGYFETYVVKVAVNDTVTISMESGQFDTYLILFRLNSYTDTSVDVTFITEDDDSGMGLNALISNVQLNAGSDYLVIARGYDYPEVGAYTLSIQ